MTKNRPSSIHATTLKQFKYNNSGKRKEVQRLTIIHILKLCQLTSLQLSLINRQPLSINFKHFENKLNVIIFEEASLFNISIVPTAVNKQSHSHKKANTWKLNID